MNYAGALAGGSLGFILGNVPGAVTGAYSGYKLGKTFDRKRYLNKGIVPLAKSYVKGYISNKYGVSLPSRASARIGKFAGGVKRVLSQKKQVYGRYRVSRKIKYAGKKRKISFKSRRSYKKANGNAFKKPYKR